MAYAKKKNPKRTSWQRKKFKNSADAETNARRATATVIIASIIIVVFALLFSYLMNPERLAKNDFSAIVADYYENYLYAQIISSERITNGEVTIGEVMEKYEQHGFAKLSLRTLLAYGADDFPEASAHLLSYCDTEETYAQIYPVSPYLKTDYRVEYNYSCEF